MADVAIIHSADKEKAAARLAEAVTAAGFAVDAVEIGDPAGLAEALDRCPADARILIWSRPLVSHALHSGELGRIRQLRGLIEVSADGITPPSRGDENRVVSISGWRGQPFHPGWQRIALELRRLCGSRKAAAEPRPQQPPPPARDARPERIAPAAASGGARPQGRRLILGGGAAVLLAAAAGAAIWFGESAPKPPTRRELPEMRVPAPAAATAGPDLGTEAESPNAPSGPPPVQAIPPPPSSVSLATNEAKAGASRPKPADGAVPIEPVVRPRQRTAPRVEPAKKYSRKNSKVMRQFCERSGRSTPQCRTFLRSVRAGGAD